MSQFIFNGKINSNFTQIGNGCVQTNATSTGMVNIQPTTNIYTQHGKSLNKVTYSLVNEIFGEVCVYNIISTTNGYGDKINCFITDENLEKYFDKVDNKMLKIKEEYIEDFTFWNTLHSLEVTKFKNKSIYIKECFLVL